MNIGSFIRFHEYETRVHNETRPKILASGDGFSSNSNNSVIFSLNCLFSW